jgi:hypothetical protein
MFSFLKNGDIHNTIKTATNLPGLFTADGDKIKYALLNYSTMMRKNLMEGVPVFTHIRNGEEEIETRRAIQSMDTVSSTTAAAASNRPSPFTDSDIRIDNAAFALIMAKELAFLNRTIQMISLVAARYQEEQDDLVWGREECEGESEENYEDDTPVRSQNNSNSNNDGEQGRVRLSTTILISSSKLRTRFNNLCALAGTTSILVNGITHNEANREKQLVAERYAISDIFLHFCKFDAEHRDPVVDAFLELRDISVSAWRMLTMFAFSNLFRLTERSEFATFYQPNDAIFAQGYCYRLASSPFYEKTSEAALMTRIPTDVAVE